MKKYLLIAFALVASATIFAIAVHKPKSLAAEVSGQVMQSEAQTIKVTGTGKVKVQPDFATIGLSVETKSRNIEEAQSENAKIVQELIETLAKHGVHESDIKTTWFNIYPDHDHYGGRVLGHRVSNNLSVKVRNIENVGKIIDASTSAGAGIVSGVQFGILDSVAPYNLALRKAVDSAREKAFVLSVATEVAGYETRIVSVKEITNNFGFETYARASADGFGGGHTQIMHDDIEVSATVEIVFKVAHTTA